MKAIIPVLFALIVLGACKSPKPPAPEMAEPEEGSMMEKNKAEKYIQSLDEDVKRAVEAEKKAEAANKSAEDASKVPE